MERKYSIHTELSAITIRPPHSLPGSCGRSRRIAEPLLSFCGQPPPLFSVIHDVYLPRKPDEFPGSLRTQVRLECLVGSSAPVLLPGALNHLTEEPFIYVECRSHLLCPQRNAPVSCAILYIGLMHHFTMPRKRSKMYSLSSGPGDASEWYWMVSTGNSRCRMPSIVPSFRFRCVTSMPCGSRLVRNREAVVLRGDVDAPRGCVLHGVVPSAMPELQFVRLCPQCTGDDLMPQADAEHGDALDDRARRLDGRCVVHRVARSRRENDAVWVVVQYLVRRGSRWIHAHPAVPLRQEPQDVVLHAAVHQRDTPAAFPVPLIRFAHRNAVNEVHRVVGGRDAISRSAACGSPVVTAPIITPWERMRRVIARVSTPQMPGTPSSAR